MIKNAKLSEELLNQKITSNHFESEHSESDTYLAFDFGLFQTKKSDIKPESLPVLHMLDEG